MDLFEKILVDERLQHINSLLENHQRTDLKVVAVNKHYAWSCVCVDDNGTLNHYSIWNDKLRNEGTVRTEFGPNYLLIDDKYSDYESVRLNMKGKYTTCSRRQLESYLAKGWEIEVD